MTAVANGIPLIGYPILHFMNKKEKAAKAKTHYWTNPEYAKRRREQVLQRQRENPESYADYQAQYAAEHRKEAVNRSKQWRIDNPIRNKALRASARAKARLLPGAAYDPATTDLIETWLSAPSFVCVYCKMSFPVALLETDHRLAICSGGPHTPENVVPCCGPCNKRKGRGNR